MSSAAESSVLSVQASTRRAFRPTALVYLDRLRCATGEGNGGQDAHFFDELLSLILNDALPDLKDTKKLRLWMLVIAACFSRISEQKILCVDKIRETMQEEELETWQEVIEICRNAIWSDVILRELYVDLGRLVMNEGSRRANKEGQEQTTEN